MLDPVLGLQTAIRQTLIAAPDLTALVDAKNIRAGGGRPDNLPSVLFSNAQTEYLGRTAGSQRAARVFLTTHIWAQEDGADTARQIGAAVFDALEFGPNANGEIFVDEWHKPSVVWGRDPQPNLTLTHGAMSLEAVIRWKV
ncbi:hypothetical protein CEW89_01625 [Celeribacter ethanolicus]|uniref:DUF3168 domain-containing protein n=1 Tax=Celeribacter ethanolicus TaxID=1758178 RepID=A0A291G8A5_9RHOB|nr:DUF3168 domain-containing protein [Celeribacter ethanolicus]ATG46378.1 hypothetical protein CEW89_01625 [Celeribacter ethanolicus]